MATDFGQLGAKLRAAGDAWEAAASAIEGQLADISPEQDQVDYVEAIVAADVNRLGELADQKQATAQTQLTHLSTAAMATADLASTSRQAANRVPELQDGFDRFADPTAVLTGGLHEFLVAQGVAEDVAAGAVAHIFDPAYPDALRRRLYARPFDIANNYDDLATSAMRSAAGARLAKLVSATRSPAAVANPTDVRSNLSALQAQMLAVLAEPGQLPQVQAAMSNLFEDAQHLPAAVPDASDAIAIGELLRETVRTAAACDLLGWTSQWADPLVAAHVFADAKASNSLEIGCPPVPTGTELAVAELLANPPTDGTAVTVVGKFGEINVRERKTHATSWSDLQDLGDATKHVAVLDLYAKLDTSGESAGTMGVLQGTYQSTDNSTGGPTVVLSHSSLTPGILARRWRTALDSIYVPRLHGEHIWWSWDVTDQLGAANPLLYGVWWR